MNYFVSYLILFIFFNSQAQDKNISIKKHNKIVSQFIVNESGGLRNANQKFPNISSNSAGKSVIVWQDYRHNSVSPSIYFQLFDENGKRIGNNVLVDSIYQNISQTNPKVCFFDDENFIIVWVNSSSKIYLRKFNSNGVPISKSFKLLTESNFSEYSPAIISDQKSNIILAFIGKNDTSRYVYAKRIPKDGNIEDFIKVTDYGVGNVNVGEPDITIDKNGDFIIVWSDRRYSEYHEDIYIQRFSADGVPYSKNIMLSDSTDSGAKFDPRIGSTKNGNYIVSWIHEKNSSGSLFATIYDKDGFIITPKFKVNDSHEYVEIQPNFIDVDMDSTGAFMIAWMGPSTIVHSQNLCAKIYSSSGIATSEDFIVNDYRGKLDYDYFAPSIEKSNNKFIISWADTRVGGKSSNIYVQSYFKNGELLDSNKVVNDDSSYSIRFDPNIDADVEGDFAVTWLDDRREIENYDIWAQYIDSEGTLSCNNIKINNQFIEEISQPIIKLNTSNNFLVTYSANNKEHYSDIYLNYFENSGKKLKEINITKTQNKSVQEKQITPAIAKKAEGNSVIVWKHEYYQYQYICARLFSSSGANIGGTIIVNDNEEIPAFTPDVAVDSDGNFLVIWVSKNNSYKNIYAQRFDSVGNKIEGNFKVTSNIPSTNENNPKIQINSEAQYIVAWEDDTDNISMEYFDKKWNSFEGITNVTNYSESFYQALKPKISIDLNNDFIISWFEKYEYYSHPGKYTIQAQKYSDNKKIGSSFVIANLNSNIPYTLYNYSTKLIGKRIYSAWCDLDSINQNSVDVWANVIELEETIISVQTTKKLNNKFTLEQNYPNPFNPTTRINYSISHNDKVSLILYDVVGREIKKIVNKYQIAGSYTVEFNASNLANGLYFYVLRSGEYLDTRKTILLK